MCPWSHSISGKSSASPRKQVIGRWVCVFTRPGMTAQPAASIVSTGLAYGASALAQAKRIFPPEMPTAASSMTSMRPDRVRRVPPVMRMSIFSVGFMTGPSHPEASPDPPCDPVDAVHDLLLVDGEELAV